MALPDDLAEAAQRFLDGLDPSRRTAALLDFDGDERRRWAYWPTARRGVPLHELGRQGTKAVHRLLAAALPAPAFARAVTIMGLDEVLDLQEGYRDDRRHRDDYWVTVFGTPGTDRWGMRIEGHHLSVHATVVAGEVRVAPLFLGANPAVVHDGDRVVAAPLAPEEDMGFTLLHALTGDQRAAATVGDEAPADIVTRNAPSIDASLGSGGIPLSALRGSAAAGADRLVALYLARFPGGARRPDPRRARFAWAGGHEPGQPHYYRIAGPRMLVELDNTQNGANHVHTVVRDPQADFGDDVLAAHHRHAHGA